MFEQTNGKLKNLYLPPPIFLTIKYIPLGKGEAWQLRMVTLAKQWGSST
jgi:hypothetical protein